ncbi:MAG: hypothetical protein Q7R53_02530 [bacterium]|nr:hypothetical protein [bacterium]
MSVESELGRHLGKNFEAVLNGSLFPNPERRQEVLDKAMAEPAEGPVHADRLTGRVLSEVV